MRINRYIALSTGMGRRTADKLIASGHIKINDKLAVTGVDVKPEDEVTLDNMPISLPAKTQTIILNKPVGYVCSRDGQGSKTIYDLLPNDLHKLKPVGRLDKDSSGLLLLTNDGELANKLTHPSFEKEKVYEVKLNRALSDMDIIKIRAGILLEDGVSKFDDVFRISELEFRVSIHEGRNRQIRRTFSSLGYDVKHLHRIRFGPFNLNQLKSGLLRRVII